MFQSMDEVNQFFIKRKNLGINPGLDRMLRLLESQNNPHQKFKSIHIAGTNGKGSTLTFLKDALIHNGYCVGVFSSPSLTGMNGHIKIDDRSISDEDFLTLFHQLLPTITLLDSEEMAPTEFEIITAICFMYFSERVDIAIIEAGMGGRGDSTNCIDPILSIITNIAMDHAGFLGDTLEKIAFQKAGIIKEKTPVILGDIDETCLPVVRKEAMEHRASMYQLYVDYTYYILASNTNMQTFNWQLEDTTYSIEIVMQGEHQVKNASIAMMALKVLETNGIRINWESVLIALKGSSVNGRFERLQENPLIILDGAHNPNGMEAFLRTVDQKYEGSRKHLIFAGFRDKELTKMVEMALPIFDSVTITNFDHPRAEVAENILQTQPTSFLKTGDWKEIIDKITYYKSEKKDAYFFAGSLHFIGLVREYITSQNM